MRILEIFLAGALLLTAFFFNTVSYGLSQLKGQVAIVLQAEPIEVVLEDPSVSDSLKTKLLLIGEIKKFAIDSLGLAPTSNYSTLYDQHGKPLLMNLTASEKYQLKAYTWYFPLLGTVSYKGFFNFEKGRREAERLEKENYDVDYSPVSAWSTLGWFRDPVFSGMLKRSEGQLAELILHEMTHATIYLKSSVDFNENLASAVGETGAEKFLEYKYGHQSSELETYRHELSDYNRYAQHMLLGARLLDSLYIRIAGMNDDEKSARKNELITDIVIALDSIPFHNKKYQNRFAKKLPDNTDFLSYIRYDSQKEEMKNNILNIFHGDLRKYIASLKSRISG